MTARQLLPILTGGKQTRTAAHDPDRLREQINNRRLAKGLPPVRPNNRR